LNAARATEELDFRRWLASANEHGCCVSGQGGSNLEIDSTPEGGRQSLVILNEGACEPLKAAVHTVALGLSALMAAYNGAAWLRRRQSHLAVNAVIYAVAVVWEIRRVADHLVPCMPQVQTTVEGPDEPVDDQLKAA
jgi:hypothetical protein